ncbi:MAG: CidA/LrgA family protein [Colwellia sp.]|nr:CidA/LrgA family protein [Colwellia sp.]
MNFLNGLTLLLVHQLLGEVLSRLLQIPIPGPVLGMLLLFLSLFFFNKINSTVNESSSAILSHLSLLFIPAGVGLMTHFSRLKQVWLPISMTLFLGAIISFVATAWLMQLTVCLLNKKIVQESNDE